MSRMPRADFEALVARAMAEPGRAHMRPVVEKELLHYDILWALDRARLLERLTFQGGTALRLVYGSARYSEDLDFVGGTELQTQDLTAIRDCIQEHVGNRYGLNVYVREPRHRSDERADAGVQVHKWQVSVDTAPQRPDLPRQRIKVEVVDVPAHTRSLKRLRVNYDFLPDGYDDVLIMTESLNEILADKLVSFVNSRYPRYLGHQLASSTRAKRKRVGRFARGQDPRLRYRRLCEAGTGPKDENSGNRGE